jgi:hypothetical protein
MKEEQKQELIKFLTLHAYPKIAADIKYIDEIRETANQVKDKEAPYKHLLEQFCYKENNIAEFVREKNSESILPLLDGLNESQLEKLICNGIEPIAYIIAITQEKWDESRKRIDSFKLGRIGLEIFSWKDF